MYLLYSTSPLSASTLLNGERYGISASYRVSLTGRFSLSIVVANH